MDLFTNLRTRMNRREDDRGAILILTALVMLLLLFIAAFATDLGAWYRQGQAQQQAADVTSLNGVQAYDREVQAYLESFGQNTVWNDLSDAEREEGEERAMLAVVNTVIGLLETNGLSFSDPEPDSLILAIPPNMLGDESIATITADDGTVVRIIRGVVEVNGHLVSTVRVEISAPGQQFISGLLRDAPTIESAAESTVSNCGAECEEEVTIDPPFTGFNAGGSGDGTSPLLFGNDQVWAVNHHSNRPVGIGDIVCLDRESQTFCDTDGNGISDGLFPLTGYHTAVFPNELLAEDVGKIYFAATRISDFQAGVGCFDVVRGNFCTTEFLPLFPGGDGSEPFSSSATGVFRHGTNVWVTSHFGTISCVTMSADPSGGMTSCGTHETAAFGQFSIPALTYTGDNRISWGTVRGDQLFAMNRNRFNAPVMHCFDFSDQQPCNNWSTATLLANGDATRGSAQDGTALAFEYYDTAGDFIGICATRRANDNTRCVNTNGVEIDAPPGIKASVQGVGGGFVGQAYVWQGKRLFLNGGAADTIACYDFENEETCAQAPNGVIQTSTIATQEVKDQNVIELADGVNGNDGLIEPYQLAEVTSECLIGLGDESVFFSLSPTLLTGCVDTITSTLIEPCLCTGTGIPNWAAIQLPQDLLDSVNSLEATARDATPGTTAEYLDGAGNDCLPDPDLPEDPNCQYTSGSGALVSSAIGQIVDLDVSSSGTNGFVNLSGISSDVLKLELQLRVDSKIDPATQLPVFASPATFDISIVSQPTLTN